MPRPTSLFLSLLFLALTTLSSALPSQPSSSSASLSRPIVSLLAERGIGEEAERKLWRRQLANSALSGLSWTLVDPTTTASTSQAMESSTRTSETSSASRNDETASSSSNPPTSTSIIPTSSSTTTSTRSSSSTVSSASTTTPVALKSRSIASRSSLSSSVSHSASSAVNAAGSAKVNAVQDSNIFNPSNKLFAVGIVVILASIVISIFIIIFIIKRISHSSRFIDPLDYPEKYPHHHSGSQTHIPTTAQPPSPSASIDSYDSLEKQPLPLTASELAQIKRHEFGATVAAGGLDGGGPIARSIVSRPPLASLPSTPLPPRNPPFTNLKPLPTNPRTRAPPPAPLHLSSNFSAPTFDRLARPPRAEKPLPPSFTSSSSTSSQRPSYISTLPLSPTLKAPTTTAKREYFSHPTEPPRSFSTTPPSSRSSSSNLTSLPARSNQFPQPPPRSTNVVPKFDPSPRNCSTIPRISAVPGQIVKHLPPAPARGNEYSVKKGRESPLRGEAFRRAG
ncbi:hypothetical protein JCM5353_006336 [Sporobolomyces roseus]